MAIPDKFRKEFEQKIIASIRTFVDHEKKTLVNLTDRGYAALEYLYEHEDRVVESRDSFARNTAYWSIGISILAFLLALAAYLRS